MKYLFNKCWFINKNLLEYYIVYRTGHRSSFIRVQTFIYKSKKQFITLARCKGDTDRN